MDGQLLRRVAAGDRQAYEALYAQASGPIYQLAAAILGHSADAEDVAQEVLVQLWRDAGRYDSARGTPLSWALAIARSRALDRARSTGARRRLAERLAQSMRPEAAVERIEDEAPPVGMRQAIAALPPEQRQVVELAYFAGMSQTEMSAALAVPLGTIKTRAKLAMEKLRAALPHE